MKLRNLIPLYFVVGALVNSGVLINYLKLLQDEPVFLYIAYLYQAMEYTIFIPSTIYFSIWSVVFIFIPGLTKDNEEWLAFFPNLTFWGYTICIIVIIGLIYRKSIIHTIKNLRYS